MRKFSVFLILVALIAGMAGCDQSTAIEINDWYDLDAVRDNLSGSYVLMNDLDSTTSGYEELAAPTANGGKGWQPIGSSHEFVGTFDGRGYEICDLFINRPDEYNVGLFGIVYFGGSITNLGVVNATVIGYMWVGGLVALSVGTVSNSYSAASVNGTDDVGGLVGGNGDGGTVSNSYSTGRISGSSSVGGMVGSNTGTVGDCHATASVSGEGWVGGLVGSNYKGTVSNSYATGSVSVTHPTATAGGLVGINHRDSTISYSYSTGNVTGEDQTGGLVGANDGGTVTNSYSTGSVTGNRLVGGSVGANTGAVTNSYSTGSVTGVEEVGGLVGGSSGNVTNSYSTGSVTGNNFTGGLVGYNTGTASNSFWDTETSGQATSAGGTGKTTAEMQETTTLSDAGWDITMVATANDRDTGYIWNIVDDETYPFLSWQPTV